MDSKLHGNLLEWPVLPGGVPGRPEGPSIAPPDPGVLVEEIRGALEAVRTGRIRQSAERLGHIRNFRSTRYRLIDDLAISVQEEGDGFTVRSYDTGQYGYGVSAEDAVAHLCSVLEEYYALLQEERDNLGEQLESHLRYLDSVLESIE